MTNRFHFVSTKNNQHEKHKHKTTDINEKLVESKVLFKFALKPSIEKF